MPTTIVNFGASGDLTRRKLIPALFSLRRKNRLSEDFNIVGFSRSDWDRAEFQQKMQSGVEEFVKAVFSGADWESFAKRPHYFSGSFTEDSDYAALEKTLQDLEGDDSHRLYYLATPPRFFAEIVTQLERAGVVPEFQTPTYAAIQLFIDNWRWQDVPIYLRSGKELAQKATEIII